MSQTDPTTEPAQELPPGLPVDVPSTDDIFDRLVRVALEEADEGWRELVFAGLAAGLCISLSFLGIVHMAVFTGSEMRVLTALLYPLGFMFIVLGRYQLYTENTLTPVVLVLERRRSLPDLFRVWGIVLGMNLVGATLGALAISYTGLLGPDAVDAAHEVAEHAMSHGPMAAFWKAVVAGWLVAGMTWIVHGTRSTTARILIIWFFLYCVGAFDLVHCIAGAAEAVYAVVQGVAVWHEVLLGYMLPAVLGNTVGGVVLVAILNYAQTQEHRRSTAKALTLREMLIGSGRQGS